VLVAECLCLRCGSATKRIEEFEEFEEFERFERFEEFEVMRLSPSHLVLVAE